MLGIFLYVYMTSPLPAQSTEPSRGETSPTIVASPDETESAESEETADTTFVPEMTKAPLTSDSEPGETDEPGETGEPGEIVEPGESGDGSPPRTDYEAGFFSGTLFVGDSIFTGLSGYGLIFAGNVFADIGLSPAGALSKTINNRGVIETAADFDRVVIMLGTNGLAAANASSISESMKTLVNSLKSAYPGIETVILTVPPVASSVSSDYSVTIDMINEYNSLLRGAARETGCILIDVSALLKDDGGYLRGDYAQPDGMHLTVSAYKALLSYVQTELE
jgi:hypothetical protein